MGLYTAFHANETILFKFHFWNILPWVSVLGWLKINSIQAILKIHSSILFQSPEDFSMDFSKGAEDLNIHRKNPMTCQHVPSVWLTQFKTDETAHATHPQNGACNGKSDRPLTIVALLGAAIILPS